MAATVNAIIKPTGDALNSFNILYINQNEIMLKMMLDKRTFFVSSPKIPYIAAM